jgi:hypothetical protein
MIKCNACQNVLGQDDSYVVHSQVVTCWDCYFGEDD